MNILKRISRHAAVAQGNFGKMFRDVKVDPLPQAVSRILEEIHRPDPDIAVLENLIAAEPEISIRILATVNSSLHALRSRVTTVRHALTLLGLDRIRSLVLAGAMMEALPRPDVDLFDHQAYWTDTLMRSLFARELAARRQPGQEELAFTAMLLTDVAVPVLLMSWEEYYRPLLEEWAERPTRLAHLERGTYGWEHGQAGSWILRYWEFPDELVGLVAAHNQTPDKLEEMGLTDTVAPVLVVAGLLPSCLHADLRRCDDMIELARDRLGIDVGDWPGILESVRDQFTSINAEFGLEPQRGDRIFEHLEQMLAGDRLQPCL